MNRIFAFHFSKTAWLQQMGFLPSAGLNLTNEQFGSDQKFRTFAHILKSLIFFIWI